MPTPRFRRWKRGICTACRADMQVIGLGDDACRCAADGHPPWLRSAAARERNEDRLVAALGAVRALAPDLLFVTGDLTQDGEPHDYRRLAAALEDFPGRKTGGRP